MLDLRTAVARSAGRHSQTENNFLAALRRSGLAAWRLCAKGAKPMRALAGASQDPQRDKEPRAQSHVIHPSARSAPNIGADLVSDYTQHIPLEQGVPFAHLRV